MTSGAPRLATSILGLELDSPVLVASGPLTDSLGGIVRAFEAGAGGIVTKTIYAGKRVKVKERIQITPVGTFNSTTYSRVSLDKWRRVIGEVSERSLPILVSVHAETPRLLADLARAVVDAGAPALELGLCCPNDGSHESAGPREIAKYVREARAAVPVPIAVKLTAGEGLQANVASALDAGADALSLSDALPGLLVDVERATFPLGSSVGFSGPAIKPIVLHAIHRLREDGVSCPIFGIGGVGNASDVLEYLHAGANAVQVYTALMTSKMGLLTTMNEELSRWCTSRGRTVRELSGAAGAPRDRVAARG